MATPPEGGGEVDLGRVQVVNLVLVVAVAGLALIWSRGFALGVAAGGLLMAVNFRVIVTVIRRMLLRDSGGVASAGGYWLKFFGLLGLVGVLIYFARVDAIGFLVGLSTLFVALVVEAALRLMRS